MKLQLLIITAVAMAMTACGNKKSNSGTRINRAATNQVATGTTSCSATSWGRIYDNNTDEYTFKQKVADITFRDISELGSINPQYNSTTGIEFQMTLRFSGGNLITTGTAQTTTTSSFKISDSITVNENGGYINFVLAGVRGYGSNGQIDATLGDDKGTIRLIGNKQTMSGQSVYFGKAYYNNNNAGDQYLGDFVISSCAVVGI
jgi:hypothetical protein